MVPLYLRYLSQSGRGNPALLAVVIPASCSGRGCWYTSATHWERATAWLLGCFSGQYETLSKTGDISVPLQDYRCR